MVQSVPKSILLESVLNCTHYQRQYYWRFIFIFAVWQLTSSSENTEVWFLHVPQAMSDIFQQNLRLYKKLKVAILFACLFCVMFDVLFAVLLAISFSLFCYLLVSLFAITIKLLSTPTSPVIIQKDSHRSHGAPLFETPWPLRALTKTITLRNSPEWSVHYLRSAFKKADSIIVHYGWESRHKPYWRPSQTCTF